MFGLFPVCPSVQSPGITSVLPKVRGELYPTHGLKSLIPSNLTTWNLIMQISSWLNGLSFQLQNELSEEEGWANPLGIWDLGLKLGWC